MVEYVVAYNYYMCWISYMAINKEKRMDGKEKHNQEADRLMTQLSVEVVYRCGDGLWFTDEKGPSRTAGSAGKGYIKFEKKCCQE